MPQNISFDEATSVWLHPPGLNQVTWDAAEVIVYSIEEAIFVLQLRTKEAGDMGKIAKGGSTRFVSSSIGREQCALTANHPLGRLLGSQQFCSSSF